MRSARGRTGKGVGLAKEITAAEEYHVKWRGGVSTVRTYAAACGIARACGHDAQLYAIARSGKRIEVAREIWGREKD